MRVSWIILISVINLVIHVRATCDYDPITCSSDKEKRHCQFDGETQVEFCATPILCEAGQHAFLHDDTKSVSCEECAEDMFQPAAKLSNIFTQPNCDEPITPCTEQLHQVVCEKATIKQNNKCACNHTAGYKVTKSFHCDVSCFSQDSACECEFQPPVFASDSTSTPSSSSVSMTIPTTTSTSSNTKTIVLSTVLPIIVAIVGIAGVCIYCFCTRNSPRRNSDSKKNEDEVESLPLTGNKNQPTKDQKIEVTGESKAVNDVKAIGILHGGMDNKNISVFSCCNCIKDDTTNRQSNSNISSKDKQNQSINVTGAIDPGSVNKVIAAGSVQGGIGNINNPDRVRAPIAPSEDTNV